MKLLLALSTLVAAAASKNAVAMAWSKDSPKESVTSILVAARSLRKLGASADFVVVMSEEDEGVENAFLAANLNVEHGDLSTSLSKYDRVQVLDYHVVLTANPDRVFELAPEAKLVESEDKLWYMMYPTAPAVTSTTKVIDEDTLKSLGLVSFTDGVWTEQTTLDASMAGARVWWELLAEEFGYSKATKTDISQLKDSEARKLMDYSSTAAADPDSSTAAADPDSSTAAADPCEPCVAAEICFTEAVCDSLVWDDTVSETEPMWTGAYVTCNRDEATGQGAADCLPCIGAYPNCTMMDDTDEPSAEPTAEPTVEPTDAVSGATSTVLPYIFAVLPAAALMF